MSCSHVLADLVKNVFSWSTWRHTTRPQRKNVQRIHTHLWAHTHSHFSPSNPLRQRVAHSPTLHVRKSQWQTGSERNKEPSERGSVRFHREESLRYAVWKCAGRPQHITFLCKLAETAQALNHRLQKGSGLLRRVTRWPPDTKHYFLHVVGRRHGGAFSTANLSLLISVFG